MSSINARLNLRLLGFMIGAALFFAVTLLISFFVTIVVIDRADIPGDVAPNVFMIGLVPPSVLTVLLFTKVLGRFV